MTRLPIGLTALAATAALLAGCGSSGDDTSTAATATASDTPAAGMPSGAPGGGPGGMDAQQLAKIRACLEAAGLEDQLPTFPSGQPSDGPTGEPPSDMPSDLPTDLPSGEPGAMFSEEVLQALTACGIELPSGGPSAQASAG